MKLLLKLEYYLVLFVFTFSLIILAENQTKKLSPIVLNPNLPFKIDIELAPFQLPAGLQAYSLGVYKNKWLFIGGRLNGLHGFNNTGGNFPRNKQNTSIFVFDIETKTSYSRALSDAKSGLSQAQIDSLAVTSAQSYQKGNTLYITGGYGIDTATESFTTKSILTAINIPGLINWVVDPASNSTAIEHIRQISDPTFQVTGGYMNQVESNPTLLIFGQDFEGQYGPTSNGIYTRQVRRFNIIDNGTDLSAQILAPIPLEPDPSFRRRDLNILARFTNKCGNNDYSYLALAGVFTPGDDPGIWTVPVEISAKGKPSMANPRAPETFKQGFNIYNSAVAKLYSERENSTHILIFGGITFAYLSDGHILTDSEFPFTNQIIAIKVDAQNNFTQSLLDTHFPVIPSTFSNPGNELLFGAEAQFIPADISLFGSSEFKLAHKILNLDSISAPLVIGYIVGGIQSTLPNTNTITDSAASPYIFTITLTPLAVSSLAESINGKYCATPVQNSSSANT